MLARLQALWLPLLSRPKQLPCRAGAMQTPRSLRLAPWVLQSQRPFSRQIKAWESWLLSKFLLPVPLLLHLEMGEEGTPLSRGFRPAAASYR